GIYWDAFAKQHEPIASWQRALRGDDAYRLTIRLALDGDAIAGGIAFELYPRSRCGLITYMVIAPSARRIGLGKRLQGEAVAALFGDGAVAVFGEINDPRITTIEGAEAAWTRLERNQRWGARVLDIRYIQPALGPGLVRDRELVMIALAGATPLQADMPGAIVRAFVDELYAVTEGGAPDLEIQIGERVRLVEMQR
ncbi:MAG TPA: GNAT family N-acetyltransferase, partial [Kofleriaceae bacterium]|nr:GNAT family N-acetyltransferase [Kofleriaceae bacterium]